MKTKLDNFAGRYLAALRKYLKPGAPAGLQAASRLGGQAVTLKLETLALARIHESAMAALDLSKSKKGLTQRAEPFFDGVNACIEETHLAARRSRGRVSELKAKLGRRTEALSTSNRKVKRGVVHRKVMEDAAEKVGKDHRKCLKESLQLQHRLRQLTHQMLTAHEDERKKISHELQDEIAQTLIGINVRLLTLKHESRGRSQGFKDEITGTQRLLAKSAGAMRRVTRKFKKV